MQSLEYTTQTRSALANNTPNPTAAPTFCKCTCFSNSTIVRLGPKDSSSSSPAGGSSPSPNRNDDGSNNPNLFLRSLNPFTTFPPPPSHLNNNNNDKRAASTSCAQCTRAFCLGYNLPICEHAEEKDVVTMCFQRDSRKDMIIVWGFIVGTLGLLGWAALKRLVELREDRSKIAGASPLGGGGGSGIGMGLPGGGVGGGRREDRGAYAPVGAR
ncbi:hypothetical protein TruAng_004365 [Truncatella angustata]|nr:hypothetical protein TruAng_004365 [Truncatella angustata]